MRVFGWPKEGKSNKPNPVFLTVSHDRGTLPPKKSLCTQKNINKDDSRKE
jgi:hypothetical protein